MIRSTYLVTMRDYLGYVSAWGFWLGLLFTPIILGIFILAPTLAQNAQPTRYFAVIEAGDTFTNALTEQMTESVSVTARAMLDPIAIAQNQDSEKLTAYDEARANGATVEEAFSQAGGFPDMLPRQDFVQVDAPVSNSADLAPYITGATLVDTSEGPQPLFAAFVVNDESGEIEYWSENLQAQALMSFARQAERELQLDRALATVRSEEHTSELQSPVPISYAVFCLKKKKIRSLLNLQFPYKISISSYLLP